MVSSNAGDVEAGSGDLSAALLKSDGYGGENEERIGMDEMLRRYAGEFGRWQLRHFVLANSAWALEAFHTMVMIFADQEPAGAGAAAAAGGASTVTEWGLVGREKYKVGLVQSVFFAGAMVGAGVFGHLSDSSLGRKGTLTVVCMLNAIFGVLTSLSPSYWVYTALRLATGFSAGGLGLSAFVLATEPVGPSKRGIAGMSTFYFFSAGIALLSAIAYVFPAWRTLYVVTSLPSLLFLFFLPFISESPRWYLVRRRTEDAMKVMHAIAHANGKQIPAGVTLVLDNDDGNNDNSGKKEEPASAISGSLVDVIRSPMTRTRLYLMVAINFMCSVVYYGLNLNVVNLKTNLYLTVFLNAVAEMPAYVLTAVLLDWLGRKPLGVATQWLAGAFCIAASMLGTFGVMKAARMACGVVGIFGIASTYNLLFIYTAELFPTVVRNAALGCAAQAGQMGAILAPMVVVFGERVPFVVFGACGIIGGILAYYLPETKDKPLYDTMGGMAEAEGETK